MNKKMFLIRVILILQVLLFQYSFSSVSTDFKILKYNLVRELPDIYIHADCEKIGVTWSNGIVWEKHLIEKFHSLLPKNDFFVVLDLGAQTGCFTLLAKYFPDSIWYAFEPIKEAADLLKKILR